MIAVLQSAKVRHEFPHRDFEDFEQTRVLEQSVRHLRECNKQNFIKKRQAVSHWVPADSCLLAWSTEKDHSHYIQIHLWNASHIRSDNKSV